MRRLVLSLGILWAPLASAGVLNYEFKFTPYSGDLQQDHVDSVAGRARVYLNNALVAEQELHKESLPVLFDDREIAPSVWVPAASMGPALRKGGNHIRIEFVPADPKLAYKGQLSWAQVNDEAVESDDGAGTSTSSNQSGEGKEDRPATGMLVLERDFDAPFATDYPWHHFPPVAALSDADKAELANLALARADGFKPGFEPVYAALATHPEMQVGEIRKSKCVDAAYTAGVRVSPIAATEMEFDLSGGPEVIVRGRNGPLYRIGEQTAFKKIKGDEQQMCAAFVLSAAYPARMAFARNPAGGWYLVY